MERFQDRLAPYAPTVMRIALGLVFLFMGIPKLSNPAGFIGFVGTLGIPAFLAWLPIILEPVGGALLIVGLGTRYLGAYFALEMLITTFYVKAARGTPFIVSGRAGVGWELDLLLLAGSLALIALGAGALSIDRDVLKLDRGVARAPATDPMRRLAS